MEYICTGACSQYAVATESCLNDAAYCSLCDVYMHALWPACPCCRRPLIREMYIVPEDAPEPIYP